MLLALSVAGASPLAGAGAGASSLAADPAVLPVHHKPGHMGGPPGARRLNRDDWREERRYRREPAYTQVCRTEYRTRFDSYVGDYVREPVRTCRESYWDE
jgi:hypothetical protein